MLIDIPEGVTPRVFKMDPARDDVIFGKDLENDMVVLLEDSTFKSDPEELDPEHPRHSEYNSEKIAQNSRWCRVSTLHRDGELIRFIGTYSDGIKASRVYNRSFTWFVKK